MSTPTHIAITRQEARVLQEILRHIHTSNRQVQDATFLMFNELQQRLDATPKPCECKSTAAQRN